MNIDIHTLAIVLCVSNFLQVIALFAQYRFDKTYSGPGWWSLGSMALALGFVFNYLRNPPILGEFSFIASNALFVIGMELHYVGVLRFFGQRERRGWLIAFCVGVTLIAAYFTCFNNILAVRRVNMMFAQTVVSWLIAYVLIDHKTSSVKASAYFLASVFLFHGGFCAIFGLDSIIGKLGNLFTPSILHVAAYLDILSTSTLWAFGFILMVNQRLYAEALDAKENAELIFNTSPDAIVITRQHDGSIVDVNAGFTSLTGFTRAEVLGKSTLDFNIWRTPKERTNFINMLKVNGFCTNLEAIFQRKDGSQFFGMLSAKAFQFLGVPHLLGVTRDITERKRLEEKLQQLASTDELTSITNRHRFLELAEAEIKRTLRINSPLALALIDIDYFKHINDEHGHIVGDHALLAFTKTCRENIREIDVFARFGGDEFVLLLPETSLDQAYDVMQRVRLSLASHPVDLGGKPVSMTISVGIASLVDKEETLDTLLERADLALYRAKEAGRNCVMPGKAYNGF